MGEARADAPELKGDRVRLRAVQPADHALLLAILAEPEVAAWWGRYDADKLAEELADPVITAVWTVVLDEAVIGLVQAVEEPEPDYRSVDLDIFLSASVHGRGLGADALRTALRHMFDARGHHRATIGPSAENQRAIRSYASLGFGPVGTLRQAERSPEGRWRDTLLMEMLADDLR